MKKLIDYGLILLTSLALLGCANQRRTFDPKPVVPHQQVQDKSTGAEMAGKTVACLLIGTALVVVAGPVAPIVTPVPIYHDGTNSSQEYVAIKPIPKISIKGPDQ